MNKKLLLGTLAASLLAGPMAANAVPFSFGCISNSSAVNCAAGEAQLLLDVTDAGGGLIDFRFSNSGPTASSIEGIYWDWRGSGAFFPTGTITDSGAGVSFAWGASPANLPAGQTLSPTFEASTGLAADSNAPTQPNGVNPGEWVNFRFTAPPNFAAIIDALNSGTLRVGLHVIGFSPSGSESFVNERPPTTSVPEPTTLSLFGLALLGIGLARRRRSI